MASGNTGAQMGVGYRRARLSALAGDGRRAMISVTLIGPRLIALISSISD